MKRTYSVMTQAEILAEFGYWPSREIRMGIIQVKREHVAIAKANAALRDPRWREFSAKPPTDSQAECLAGQP